MYKCKAKSLYKPLLLRVYNYRKWEALLSSSLFVLFLLLFYLLKVCQCLLLLCPSSLSVSEMHTKFSVLGVDEHAYKDWEGLAALSFLYYLKNNSSLTVCDSKQQQKPEKIFLNHVIEMYTVNPFKSGTVSESSQQTHDVIAFCSSGTVSSVLCFYSSFNALLGENYRFTYTAASHTEKPRLHLSCFLNDIILQDEASTWQLGYGPWCHPPTCVMLWWSISLFKRITNLGLSFRLDIKMALYRLLSRMSCWLRDE